MKKLENLFCGHTSNNIDVISTFSFTHISSTRSTLVAGFTASSAACRMCGQSLHLTAIVGIHQFDKIVELWNTEINYNLLVFVNIFFPQILVPLKVHYFKVTRRPVLTGRVPFFNLLSRCPERFCWDASLPRFVDKLKLILHLR